MEERTCEFCGRKVDDPETPRRAGTRYCGDAHRQAAYRARMSAKAKKAAHAKRAERARKAAAAHRELIDAIGEAAADSRRRSRR